MKIVIVAKQHAIQVNVQHVKAVLAVNQPVIQVNALSANHAMHVKAVTHASHLAMQVNAPHVSGAMHAKHALLDNVHHARPVTHVKIAILVNQLVIQASVETARIVMVANPVMDAKHAIQGNALPVRTVTHA